MSTDSLSPPKIEIRLDPPDTVREALATFEATCAAWPPVVTDMSPVVISREALWCDRISSRNPPGKVDFDFGLIVGLLLGVAGMLAVARLAALLRTVWRRFRAAGQTTRTTS